MPWSRWLRSRSEHYLLIAAQERMARQYGTRAPRPPHGAKEFFWRRIFAPVYRALPWPLRHKILLAMPGSHRRRWAPPPRARGPAFQAQYPTGTSTRPEKEFRNGADRG